MKTIKLPVFKNCDPKEESVYVDFYDYSEDINDPNEVICNTQCPIKNGCLGIKLKNGYSLMNICADFNWIDFSKEHEVIIDFGMNLVPSREALELAFGDNPEALEIIRKQYDTFGEAKESIIR